MNYHALLLAGITLTCSYSYSADRSTKKPVSPPVHQKKEKWRKNHPKISTKKTIAKQERKLEKILAHVPEGERETFLQHIPKHLYQH
jgi:hypothetical protein